MERDLRTREAEDTWEALERRRKTEIYLDRIRGCLLGGAAGDALGYPVEFHRTEQITAQYGPEGIRDYALDASGKALISDDTQMTLFTANGILAGQTRTALRGIGGDIASYAALAYRDWLRTQHLSWEQGREPGDEPRKTGWSWLLDVPELYVRRAPGNTCLSAITAYDRRDGRGYGTSERPINQSKGCGGIMRVAPLAMAYRAGENYHWDQAALDREGAELAAITHGHPLGWMPAAALTHILSRCLTAPERGLWAIVREARDAMAVLYPENEYLGALLGIMDRAMALAARGGEDRENIRALGEGWVAEETLGIAIYCALRYEKDFSGGIIAAVNHDGDSDSTGAVTGNILGAYLGYHAIERKWVRGLELQDVIEEMADDLCHGCPMEEYSCYRDPTWERKYIQARRYQAGERPMPGNRERNNA